MVSLSNRPQKSKVADFNAAFSFFGGHIIVAAKKRIRPYLIPSFLGFFKFKSMRLLSRAWVSSFMPLQKQTRTYCRKMQNLYGQP
jgi:hypothetical protein